MLLVSRGFLLIISFRDYISAPPILTWRSLFEIIDINDLEGTQHMAGNLHVRNLDDDLIARLKRRAARHGRSTEAEHREILRQALVGEVEPSFDALAAELRKLTRRRTQTPSEILLRAGRDER
jgi:antitoxin FitA